MNTSNPTRPRLTVIGTGYLGATHAACMAELGFEVLGLDVDPEKVAALQAAQVPFYEPGLDELIAKQVAAGRLRFTTSVEEVATFGDVHFLCVGTPQKRGEFAADLRHVDAAVDALAPHLRRPCLVAWNPEFLREGFAIQDTLRPDRLVIGVASDHAEQVLRTVYAPLLDAGVPMIVTDFPTAELVKVSANAFLATKISFINAMAEA